MTVQELRKAVLKKLLRHGYIGEKHTSIDNVPKGFPKHQYGEIRKVLKSLIREIERIIRE